MRAKHRIVLKSVSVVDLANEFIERIGRLDGSLHAYVHFDPEEVADAARSLQAARDRGADPGPLYGTFLGIKDLIDVRNAPTRAGSSFFVREPAGDAPVVARLRAAGAVITGKLNTHEFAWGITTDNPHFGRTENPWDRSRIAGGSSGGSAAAVAAGLATAALGSDTLGSVRIPSAYCGLSGIRPAIGSVPMAGIFPLAPSMDIAGPLAHSVADAALLLDVMRGEDPARPLPALAGLRIARLRGAPWDTVEPEVTRAVDAVVDALRELGAGVREIEWSCSASLESATAALQRGEAAKIHAPLFREHARDYGADVRGRLQAALALDPDVFAAAKPTIARERAAFIDALREVDFALVPSVPFEAPPAGSESVYIRGAVSDMRAAVLPFMIPASAFGLPAIALPCGEGAAGLPLSVQFFGRPENERAMIAAGMALQGVTDWHLHRPSL